MLDCVTLTGGECNSGSIDWKTARKAEKDMINAGLWPCIKITAGDVLLVNPSLTQEQCTQVLLKVWNHAWKWEEVVLGYVEELRNARRFRPGYDPRQRRR